MKDGLDFSFPFRVVFFCPISSLIAVHVPLESTERPARICASAPESAAHTGPPPPLAALRIGPGRNPSKVCASVLALKQHEANYSG